MSRRLALYSMIAMFGIAYATLDRVPRAVLQVLRGGSEYVRVIESNEFATEPLA